MGITKTKRRRALHAIAKNPGLSNRHIADLAHVSHTYIAKLKTNMPAPDFTTARESLNDDIADFINKTKDPMYTTLFKPTPNHLGSMGVSKSKQHGWDPIDPLQFELCMIDKNKLYVDHGVQRSDVSETNINYIAAHWNWACVGALIVGLRPNGKYVVVEGQHRLVASMKRIEVVTLPCVLIVFRDLEHEAATFLAINTCRKAVSTMDKHRVGVVAKDADVLAVNALLESVGVTLARKPNGSCQTNAVTTIRRMLQDKGPGVMAMILSALRQVQWDDGIPASTIRAMGYMHKNLYGGIDARFVSRLIGLGGKAILRAERSGSALGGSCGEQWITVGILDAVNKGLKVRYAVKAQA